MSDYEQLWAAWNWPVPWVLFGTLSDAYTRAARILSKGLDDSDMPEWDALPVVFVYRHAIELSLKAVLIAADPGRIQDILKGGHRLNGLATSIKPALEGYDCADFETTSMNLPSAIRFFNDVEKFDSNGMLARYPVKKDGTPHKNAQPHPSNAEEPDALELRSFIDQCEAVLKWLSCVQAVVCQGVDAE